MIDDITHALRGWTREHLRPGAPMRRVVCLESGPDRWTWTLHEDVRQVGMVRGRDHSARCWGAGADVVRVVLSRLRWEAQIGPIHRDRQAEQTPTDYGSTLVAGRAAS